MRASRSFLTTAVALGLLSFPASNLPAQECPAEPTHDPAITSPEAAIPGFPDRPVTSAEINAYVQQVADESPRVEAGQFATSWNGTPLLHALVSTEGRADELDALADRQQRLRDPRLTTAKRARRIAKRTPAIVWYTANVHGNETSGADAALSILYDLASRTDCEVLEMLDELVLGIMPAQNPDGRDAASRTNVYGFDMNRDWFARTQPETDGKLELLRRYPPVMLIDAHEMGSSNFFFPPNADPIHHEISSESVHWINDFYAPALREAFEERQSGDPANWDYFNYDIYDLFYMGYGDTVSTTGFTAAGMTYEKGIADSPRQRWEEQYVAGWTTLRVAAEKKDTILRQYARAHRVALREGRLGTLERNVVLQPENSVQRQVPKLKVRHYFIPPAPRTEVAHLVERLLEMDVEVYRLRRALRVRGFQEYGRGPGTERVARGWYWVPMDQPQKRWVQAMLGEESYVPFPYFYDVTAWSNPLLLNILAGFTGRDVRPKARRVRTAPAWDPSFGASFGEPPRIALYTGGPGGESLNHLRFTLDHVWEVPYTEVTGTEVLTGALGDHDVFIVPGIDTTELEPAAPLVQAWIEGGGTYIGAARGGSGGTPYAVSHGFTSSQLTAPAGLQIPGTMFRVRIEGGDPITAGAPPWAYWYHLGEDALTKSTTGRNLAVFPAREPDFWVSGYAEGQEGLKDTAGLVAEDLGDGRAVLFSGEPNYRAYTEGVARFLAKAIATARTGEEPPAAPVNLASPEARPAVRAAMRSAPEPWGPGRPIRIEVPASQRGEALGVLRRFTSSVTVERARGSAFLEIENDAGLPPDAHPFSSRLLPALDAAGIAVRSAIL